MSKEEKQRTATDILEPYRLNPYTNTSYDLSSRKDYVRYVDAKSAANTLMLERTEALRKELEQVQAERDQYSKQLAMISVTHPHLVG